MSDKPLVSIVLPVYNGEKYLSFAIESVINQSYENWELIIIDDCSTDGTGDIIKKYSDKDSRVKSYKNNTNLKLPNSLNRGFRLAKGKYYTWTSDDNILKANMLEVFVNELEQNSGIGMVYSDADIIDEFGNINNVFQADIPNALVYGNVVGASFMYRSDVAKRVGEYEATMFLVEDYDYWLRIYQETEGYLYFFYK